MRSRAAFAAVIAAALLAGPCALAQAAPSTLLKLPSCRVGGGAKQGHATFYARMYAISGSTRMAVRFTLLDRAAGARAQVPVSELAQWHRSRSGVRAFGFSQTVTGLRAGGAYAASVEFRWFDARGRVIRSAHRTSPYCRQRALPNLTITGISARHAGPDGTERYGIDVSNRGSGPAAGVMVDLFVDGAAADAAQIRSLAPGETVRVNVDGPVCIHRVRAVVDPGQAIQESVERDNALRSRCPAVAG